MKPTSSRPMLERLKTIKTLAELYKLVNTKNMKEKEEILNDQTGGKLNTKDASELITKTEVPFTPFTIIGREGKYFLALGQSRISELYNSEDELKTMVFERDWYLIINTIFSVARTTIALEKQGQLIEEYTNVEEPLTEATPQFKR